MYIYIYYIYIYIYIYIQGWFRTDRTAYLGAGSEAGSGTAKSQETARKEMDRFELKTDRIGTDGLVAKDQTGSNRSNH
jgi:hypothetical protein